MCHTTTGTMRLTKNSHIDLAWTAGCNAVNHNRSAHITKQYEAQSSTVSNLSGVICPRYWSLPNQPPPLSSYLDERFQGQTLQNYASCMMNPRLLHSQAAQYQLGQTIILSTTATSSSLVLSSSSSARLVIIRLSYYH